MHARQTALNTAFAAVLMLLYGWFGGLQSISDDPLYHQAVTVFQWTLRLGGIALFAAAFVCMGGFRAGLLMDALAGAVCGAMLLGCVGVWFAKGVGFDLQDLVILLFSLMLLRGAWISFRLFRETPLSSNDPAQTSPVAASPETSAPHPASVHPPTLPRDGEPPPPDGYLSALAREKDEPPTASYE